MELAMQIITIDEKLSNTVQGLKEFNSNFLVITLAKNLKQLVSLMPAIK